LSFLASVVVISSMIFGTAFFVSAEDTQTYDKLQDQINEVQAKIDSLKKQEAVYQKNIRIKQDEGISLRNQLDILDNKMAESELEIESTEQEIKKNELETRNTELQILDQEDVIVSKKGELGETLKQINNNSDVSAVEIFILNKSISDFFIYAENTKILSKSLNDSLEKVKSLRKELTEHKELLDKKTVELRQLKENIDLQMAELDNQKIYKDDLLVETKQSEQKFYNLFWQAKEEIQSASSEITGLEKLARAKLNDNKNDQPKLTDSTLIWPIPKNKITAKFHDPAYPYKYLFEHPAIDVRCAQGTSVKAAADGYILKARDAGMGYSYIAVIHANGLSTVYGHVSKIFVKADEYVAKGEVIGLSGGSPGTPGAGRLTTGPHMHFEVRLNGIPVNPELYLP